MNTPEIYRVLMQQQNGTEYFLEVVASNESNAFNIATSCRTPDVAKSATVITTTMGTKHPATTKIGRAAAQAIWNASEEAAHASGVAAEARNRAEYDGVTTPQRFLELERIADVAAKRAQIASAAVTPDVVSEASDITCNEWSQIEESFGINRKSRKGVHGFFKQSDIPPEQELDFYTRRLANYHTYSIVILLGCGIGGVFTNASWLLKSLPFLLIPANWYLVNFMLYKHVNRRR